MFDEQQGKCWICGELMLLNVDVNHPEFATFDHIKAKSAGGTRDESNLKLAHKICNVKRGNGSQPPVVRWRGDPKAQPFTAAWLRARGYM